MKRLSVLLLLIICVFITLFVGETQAVNPFVNHIYTADPSAHVFEGRVYVYPSHDQDNPDWFNMEDYHVFSSSGKLREWVDHGVVLHLDQVPWALKWMWAPDCAYKGGTYYFYFGASTNPRSSETVMVPVTENELDFQVGVATSTSPSGPFIPEPNPIPGTDSMDPAVFVDDDGQAYLFWGGQNHGGVEEPRWAKLKSNMKEIDGQIHKITSGVDHWFEACWVHKRNGVYYLSYSTGTNTPNESTIEYSTCAEADFPNGPWHHQGEVIPRVTGWTNHHSFVEYEGYWYAFYHNCDLAGRDPEHGYIISKRGICVDKLEYNSDGTMKRVVPTKTGTGVSAYTRIKAALYEDQSGTQTEPLTNGDIGQCVNYINNGDWIRFKDVYFGNFYECGKFEATVATPNSGGFIEVRSHSANGTLLASLPVPYTGGWQNWQTVSCDLNTRPVGSTDIYLVFKGGSGYLFNLNSFRFIRNDVYAKIPIGMNVSFRSKANNKYVCADFNVSQNGPLHANRTALGPWEKFEINAVPNSGTSRYVTIKSQKNGKYWNYTFMNPIEVNTRSLGDKAKWEWINNGGTVSLRNKYNGALVALNERDQSDEALYNNGGGSRPYPEVEFYVEVSDAPIGFTVAFKSVNNGKYLSNYSSNYELAVDQIHTKNPSERFIVEDAGNGLVALKSVRNGQYLRISSTSSPVKASGGSTIEDREKFQWRNNGDGTIALKNVYYNQYLCADSNKGTNPIKLYANRDDVGGDWEKFYCQLQ